MQPFNALLRTALFDDAGLYAGIVVGLVLCIAATGKFLTLREFSIGVADLHLLPRPLVPLVSIATPSVELVVGLLLLLRVVPTFASGAASVMFVTFATIILTKVLKGETARCHCFGGRAMLGWSAFVRTVGLTSCAAAGVGLSRSVSPTLLAIGLLLVISGGVMGTAFSGRVRSRTVVAS